MSRRSLSAGRARKSSVMSSEVGPLTGRRGSHVPSVEAFPLLENLQELKKGASRSPESRDRGVERKETKRLRVRN